MTKDMLTNGMRVVLRNGRKYIVIGDSLRHVTGHIGLDEYDTNLVYWGSSTSQWDIMKVYEDAFWNSSVDTLEGLIWEREEQKQILELKETIKKAQEQIEQLERNVK